MTAPNSRVVVHRVMYRSCSGYSLLNRTKMFEPKEPDQISSKHTHFLEDITLIALIFSAATCQSHLPPLTLFTLPYAT